MSEVLRRLESVADAAAGLAQRMGRGPVERDIARLTDLLTGRRRDRSADYMNNPGLLRAYLALYAPKNAARVALLLDKLRREGHIDSLARPVRVLDVGAGPLSAVIGTWAAFGAIGDSAALDRSKHGLKAGVELTGAIDEEGFWSIKTVAHDLRDKRWPLKPSATFDLVVAANVLNELGRRPAAPQVIGWLRKSGAQAMLLMEPGTRVMSRKLMELRDELVAGGAAIAAPCPIQRHCPMLKSRDWCHTALHYERPATMRRWEKAAHIKPGPLLLSYLLVTREQATPVKARVVSGKLGDGRQQVCQAGGLVKMKLRSPHRRGDPLERRS